MAMNADVLKGKWRELKGSIKAKWGDLTDDELMKVEGREDEFLGLLQQKYGYTKDEARKHYEEFMRKHHKDMPHA